MASSASFTFQLLKRVLEVWGDRSALKHTSYEQHKYITKAILIALAFTSSSNVAQLKHGTFHLHYQPRYYKVVDTRSIGLSGRMCMLLFLLF